MVCKSTDFAGSDFLYSYEFLGYEWMLYLQETLHYALRLWYMLDRLQGPKRATSISMSAPCHAIFQQHHDIPFRFSGTRRLLQIMKAVRPVSRISNPWGRSLLLDIRITCFPQRHRLGVRRCLERGKALRWYYTDNITRIIKVYTGGLNRQIFEGVVKKMLHGTSVRKNPSECRHVDIAFHAKGFIFRGSLVALSSFYPATSRVGLLSFCLMPSRYAMSLDSTFIEHCSCDCSFFLTLSHRWIFWSRQTNEKNHAHFNAVQTLF